MQTAAHLPRSSSPRLQPRRSERATRFSTAHPKQCSRWSWSRSRSRRVRSPAGNRDADLLSALGAQLSSQVRRTSWGSACWPHASLDRVADEIVVEEEATTRTEKEKKSGGSDRLSVCLSVSLSLSFPPFPDQGKQGLDGIASLARRLATVVGADGPPESFPPKPASLQYDCALEFLGDPLAVSSSSSSSISSNRRRVPRRQGRLNRALD